MSAGAPNLSAATFFKPYVKKTERQIRRATGEKPWVENPGFPHFIKLLFMMLEACGHPLAKMTEAIKEEPEGIPTVCYILRQAHIYIVPYLLHEMEYRQLPFPRYLWPVFQKKKHHFRRIREEVWHYLFTATLGHLAQLKGRSSVQYEHTDYRKIASTHVAYMQHYNSGDLIHSKHWSIPCLRIVDIVIPGVVVTVNQPAANSLSQDSRRVIDVSGPRTQYRITELESLKNNLEKKTKEAEESGRQMLTWYGNYTKKKLEYENFQRDMGKENRALRLRINELEKEVASLKISHHSSSSSRRDRSRSPRGSVIIYNS